MHALCGNIAGVGIRILAESRQHPEERYAFLALFIMPGRVGPWNLWSLTSLPTPSPVFLWFHMENVQVAVWDPCMKKQILSYNPQMGKPSSNWKLCKSDEESQRVCYNCVLGKMGNGATPSPYPESQTSSFPHSSQSLHLESKAIHPINKVHWTSSLHRRQKETFTLFLCRIAWYNCSLLLFIWKCCSTWQMKQKSGILFHGL